MSEEDIEYLKESAIERLLSTNGLVGSLEHWSKLVKNLQSIGVNEIACLIDFGIDFNSVMDNLEQLKKLKDLVNL